MEEEFGIEEYIGGVKQPIPCILKQLYTDFIVQEIDENHLVLPILPTVVSVKEEQKVQIEVSRPECITEEVLVDLDDFDVNADGEKGKIFSINVKDLSKEQRTTIHKFVRERFNRRLNSQLKDDKIEISRDNHGNNDRKRKIWNSENPDYLHFTLSKENKDTSYALGIVAKFIGVKPDLFRFCGIKDKRAVTSQRVSCFRVEKEKLLNILPRLRDFTLFDFKYEKESLKMGGHWGNRFNIILRNVPEDTKDELLARCELFKESGFINYFGTQRFGSSIGNTAETGKLILQRKWEEAVKNILRTSIQMGNTTVAEAASHFLETGDAQASKKKLKGGQRFASIESDILHALSRKRTWQQCLTEVLPMNMRSLYVHAYQSLIWNKMVSRRIKKFGSTLIPQDVDENGKPLEDNNIFSAYIPLPGSSLTLFPEYAKIWLEELLAADNLVNDSFSALKDRFALGDSTRALLVMPGDVNYELITYSQDKEILQEGLHKDSKISLVENADNNKKLALKIQFSLPNGAYATIALRQVTGFDMSKKNQSEAGKQALDSSRSLIEIKENDATVCEAEA